ncbi:MAG: lipoprotein-releasing ABC transporter permease subunit [Desulfatiglandales bacterium]
MRFELFLAKRFLKAKPKETYLSVITVISILGILVGVMALTVVISVMNGFTEELTRKLLGINPHVLVFSYGSMIKDPGRVESEIGQIKGVEASCPFVYSQVMVSFEGISSGALIYGIDPEKVQRVLDLKAMIKKGSLEELLNRDGGYPKAVMGVEMAYKLGVKVGDLIQVISPEGKRTPLGRSPNIWQFQVAGLFESGMYEYDLSLLYVYIGDAQEFLGVQDLVSGIQIRTEDFSKADQVARSIDAKLGRDYWTKDWKMMNKNLFAALKLEKVTMFVILTMIVLVGSLNIISGLVMTVMEKKKAIAVLRTMGFSRKKIARVFVLQGLIQGILGVIGGLSLGLAICVLLEHYQFISLPKDVYPLSRLPVNVQFWDMISIAGSALILSVLAALYPAIKASRQDPLDIIRYE